MSDRSRILFVCTANLQRSPTAADLVNSEAPERYEARSAGIDPLAETQVTQAHVSWADIVIVMESMHRAWLTEHCDLGETPLYVLDIPDRFVRDDPRLKMLLRDKLADILDISW